MNITNPFAPLRASEYSDTEINNLWVHLGENAIDPIIEPRLGMSKYILGGKGVGKTHLLRYFSHAASRLRHPGKTPIDLITESNHLSLFIRATSLDAGRFSGPIASDNKWQTLFAYYFELRLAEAALAALLDIGGQCLPTAIERYVGKIHDVIEPAPTSATDLQELYEWALRERKSVDRNINNAAFSSTLNVSIRFSFGSLFTEIANNLSLLEPKFAKTPVVYLIDEIENFDRNQQRVVNTLIRHAGELSTFRLSGRHYAVKTYETINGGEENREGSEFKTSIIEDILSSKSDFKSFSYHLITSRLAKANNDAALLARADLTDAEIKALFPSYTLEDLRNELGEDALHQKVSRQVHGTISREVHNRCPDDQIGEICNNLLADLPVELAQLNLLLFFKYYRAGLDFLELSKSIHDAALDYLDGNTKSKYATARSHYQLDLFAQLARLSGRWSTSPYAGFDALVRLSNNNPRGLLIVLGRIYDLLSFRGCEFLDPKGISPAIQHQGVMEASRFFYEADTNYGSKAEEARNSVERLATLLRTARYASNIPEVSPLAVSFDLNVLPAEAKECVFSALRYSMLYVIREGRPDRNSEKLNMKVQLNPLLAPKWGLPLSRRGDIGLSTQVAISIFSPNELDAFSAHLKRLSEKWNSIGAQRLSGDEQQLEMF